MTQEIQLPVHGLNEGGPFGKHKPGTTTEMRNWWTYDSLTGRQMPAQRSGQTKVTPVALEAGRVHTLLECSYASDLMTYSNAAPATVENATTGRSLADILNGVADTYGSVYYIDGANGIVKVTDALRFIYRIALPSVDSGSVVRALAVDSAGLVFAAVSAGSDPSRARMWCFEELEDNQTRLLWELTPGWFTETLEVSPAGLYAAQNDTLRWASRMALYVGYSAPNPTLLRSWTIPYPVNDSDVSPIDGNVATTHQPQVNRGATPRSPETTAALADKSLRDLSNFGRRARTWLQARDVDGDDTNNANRVDGASVSVITDKTGNGRNLLEVATGKGLVLRKGALANQDVLSANGVDQAMKGLANVSTDILFKQSNKGIIPSHKTHQFVVFLAVQVPQSDTRSTLLSQNFTTAANVKDRRLMANASVFPAGAGATFQNANGSAFLYEEVPTAGAGFDAPWGRATATANRAVPLGGAFDAGGIVLFTWVFDHGVDDPQPTRSCLRINGRPVDRWKSDTGYENLQAAGLFCDIFGTTASAFAAGNFLELFVLEDWYESAGGIVTAQTRQRLIEMPTYPDSGYASGSQTEVEWIEGVIMAGLGAAHLLPAGWEATLEALSVVNNNDTVTIDGTVYTFKTTLTGAANEVLRDASTGTQSLRNLHHAINGTGARGTAYTSATAIHPTVWSPGVLENDGTNQRAALMAQAREPRNSVAFTVDENTAEARVAWLPIVGGAGTNVSVRNRTASATVPGLYPHPYSLLRHNVSGTNYSFGAPPPSTGTVSPLNSGVSPYGLLCLWNATNGNLKNALTTAGSGTQTGGGTFLGLGFGGIGYGIRFLPSGNLISVGPRQALVATLGVTADDFDVRKVVLTATGFTVTESLPYTTDDAWVAAPGAWDYAYPRMCVDPSGNVYIPYSGALAASMLVYKEVAAGASPVSPILTVNSLAGSPKGRAVAIDPNYPTFPNGYADPRAELAYLFTQAAATTLLALHELRLVNAAPNNVQHITTLAAAGIGTSLYQVNDDGTSALISATAFSSGARIVDWCFTFGRVFITDGSSVCRVWDPKAGTLGFWRARTGGQVPKRPLLLEAYRNRIFAGPLADERNVLVASAAGDPFGWDFAPKGDNPVTLAAWHSRLSETTADFPDNVTCLRARENDILVVGGQRSIFVLRGDPMQGGQFDLAVRGVGIAFGRAGVFTPDGTFWFISDQAELRRIMPDALASRAQGIPPLVSGDIAVRLSQAIDFSVCRPELHYDPRDKRLHILLVKHDSASTALLNHFTYEIDSGAFADFTFGTNAVQPCSMLVRGGLTDAKRTNWCGGHDGIVRKYDPAATSDDGVVIDSSMVVPLVPNENRGERWEFDDFNLLFTQDTGTKVRMEILETSKPDLWGTAVVIADGSLGPGRNTPSPRVSGNWVGMRLKGDGVTAQRIALIEARCDAREMTMESRP